ncbi:MAG: DUF1080 domain-containing protein [Planctomycetia bacterium]|nr:DUF1080 domain-containing protein [Planctomycetia bacterium]
MKRILTAVVVGLCVMASAKIACAQNNNHEFRGGDFRMGIDWKEPARVEPGEKVGDAPSDAIVLFDGTNLDAWTGGNWDIADDVLTCKPGSGSIVTKEKFGSCQLHLEFACPPVVDPNAKSQARGNSGVFFMNHYELQILDSYENDTYYEGQCGAIYKQFPPYVNPVRKPTEWQTYDVIFTRPILRTEKDENGNEYVAEVIRPAYITVLLNGVVVQNHWEIKGDTFFHRTPQYQPHGDREPISIQDHNNLTQFRNIWIREIPDSNVVPCQNHMNYYN